MATATTKLLTAEDLLRLNSQGVKGELIRGVLCETVSVGEEHGHIAGIFITYLNVHIRPQRLGRAGGTDVGVLIQRDPAMVREPDVYYVSTERLPLNIRVRGYLEVAPELVVEIVSPSDTQQSVNDKTEMWLGHGVQLVVEVYPAERAVMLHRRNVPFVTLTGDDVLEIEGILPGFSLPLAEIFDS
jgi:Uma2 family endonuclease